MKYLIFAGLLLGAIVQVSRMFLLPPTPVPCYDFLNASANAAVLFNKCTGELELRVLKPPQKPPADGSF